MTTPTLLRVVRVDARYEPGNGTSYGLAAMSLAPGEWPGTEGFEVPVLVSRVRYGAWPLDLGAGTISGDYVGEKLARGNECDGAAVLRWLEEFPGATFEALVTCGCGRHGE